MLHGATGETITAIKQSDLQLQSIPPYNCESIYQLIVVVNYMSHLLAEVKYQTTYGVVVRS